MKIIFNEKYKYYECLFYYKTIDGRRKQKHKRGLKSQKECREYEREFLKKAACDIGMSFKSLCELYVADTKQRIKQTTLRNLTCYIDHVLLQYFKDYQVNEITPFIVRRWQNAILQKGYTQTTLKQYNAVLSSIFNFACRFYSLPKNPCKIAGGIGTSKREANPSFWTPEEFSVFISSEDIKNDLFYYTVFNVLFYTGVRIGELLALTVGDVDLIKKELTINKTTTLVNGKHIITTPKTKSSTRKIDLPDVLIPIFQKYINALYSQDKGSRLFFHSREAIRCRLKKVAKEKGLKSIRIHDFRHSHASLLINMGVNIMAISQRLGHENVQVTLSIYSHLFDANKKDLLQKLNMSVNGNNPISKK